MASDIPDLTDPDDVSGLSDLEKSVIDTFQADVEEDVPVPSDAPSTADRLPPSEEAGAAAGESAAPAEDAPPAGDDEPGGEPQPAADSPPDVDTATQATLDAQGGQLTEQQQAVWEWYGTLDPQAIATIDAALSPDYTLIPVDQIKELQDNYDLLQRVREGRLLDTPTGTVNGSTPATDDFWEDMDPRVRVAFEAQQAQLAALENERMRDQVDDAVRQTIGVIESAEQSWRATHTEVTDAEWDAIQTWAVNSGQYRQLSAQYGDAEAATRLWDYAMTLQPSYQQRLIDEQVNARLGTYADDIARGQAASAVSGAASSPPTSGPAPSDEEDMVEFIERRLRGQ